MKNNYFQAEITQRCSARVFSPRKALSRLGDGPGFLSSERFIGMLLASSRERGLLKKPAFVILRIEPTGQGGDFTPPFERAVEKALKNEGLRFS